MLRRGGTPRRGRGRPAHGAARAGTPPRRPSPRPRTAQRGPPPGPAASADSARAARPPPPRSGGSWNGQLHPAPGPGPPLERAALRGQAHPDRSQPETLDGSRVPAHAVILDADPSPLHGDSKVAVAELSLEPVLEAVLHQGNQEERWNGHRRLAVGADQL